MGLDIGSIIMLVFGAVIFYGGLFVCINIALKRRRIAEKEFREGG